MTPPAGAVPLLQERLGRRDPWRVAVICTLLNKSPGLRAEPVLRALFRRWPTASAMYRDFPCAELESLVRTLGFVARRSDTIRESARVVYLNQTSLRRNDSLPKTDVLVRAETVEALSACRGVGPYAVASMRAFALGDLTARTSDAAVTVRVAYLRRAAKRKG